MTTTEPGIVLCGANFSLYECRDEEILLEARAGTGKSVAAAKKLLDACYQYPGSRHLLCRQTRKSLTDGGLVILESVIGDSHPEVMRVSREQRHSYRLNGSEIVLAGLHDEPEKAFGTAWGLIVCEEAIEIPLDSWELFGRAARDPKLRRAGKAASFPYHQRIAITNPGSPGHWLNKRAFPASDTLRKVTCWADLNRLHMYNDSEQPGVMRRMIGCHQDNPVFFDVDRWEWTAEGIKYLNSLGAMSEHRRLRMLEGLWVATEGGVFSGSFGPRNIVPPFIIPQDWPVWCYMDPGYDHPCAVAWYTMGPAGRRWIIDEIYVRQTDADIVFKDIIELERRRGYKTVRRFMDPRYGWQRTQQSRITQPLADIAKQYHGLHFDPWPATQKASKVAAVELLRRAFGDESLAIFDRCPNAINEFYSWKYKRKMDGSVPDGDDAYEDNNNHCIYGDTLIWTTDGLLPIRDLRGGFVCTPWGVRRYSPFPVRKRKCWEWRFSDGTILKATPEHKIFTSAGWIPIGCVNGGLLIYLWDAAGGNHISKAAAIRRESVSFCRSVLFADDTRLGSGMRVSRPPPASGGVALPPWHDPYGQEVAHSPQGRESSQQSDRESGVAVQPRPHWEAFDARAPGVVQAQHDREGGTGGACVAQERGWKGLAQPTWESRIQEPSIGENYLRGMWASQRDNASRNNEILREEVYGEGAVQAKEVRLVSSRYIGLVETYDLSVDELHCFVANGVIVSNCIDGATGFIINDHRFSEAAKPRVEDDPWDEGLTESPIKHRGVESTITGVDF